MTWRKSLFAGSMILFPVLAMAFAATAPPSGPDSQLDSLVLVLNIISTTHARPTTGVVLATSAEGEFSLIAVPADFVSAGDRIEVLDGGNDLLRNGRSTRTVARSLEAGIALLEVKGLRRSGVELSADVWPPAEATEYQFVAWPPAEALAEGTPMIRTSVRLEPGSGAAQLVVTPELPGVSGPLFDRCGRMAAFHLGGSDARLLGVGGLEKLARSVDKEVISVTCEPESLTARTETENAAEEPAVVPGSGEAAPSPGVSESVSPGAGEQSVARASWWLAAVLIGLLGIVLYLHIRKNQGGRRILLEGKRAHGRTVNCEVRFPRGGEHSRLERQDRTFLFMIDGNRALVTQPDEGIPEVLALAVAGTPCLPGEIFALVDGQEIQLGDELFVARLELDRPKSI